MHSLESQLISVGDSHIVVIVDEVLDLPVLEAHLLERSLDHVVSLIFAYLLVLFLSQLRGIPAVVTRRFGRTLDDLILAVLALGGGVLFRTAARGASLVLVVDQEVGLDSQLRCGDSGVAEYIAVRIIRLNNFGFAENVTVRIIRFNFFFIAILIVLVVIKREFVFLLVDFICGEQSVVDGTRDQLKLEGTRGPVNRNRLLSATRARGTSTAALLLIVLRHLLVVSSESGASLQNDGAILPVVDDLRNDSHLVNHHAQDEHSDEAPADLALVSRVHDTSGSLN